MPKHDSTTNAPFMKSIHASDETNLTEIEILTDGRILLFGASARCSMYSTRFNWAEIREYNRD